MRSYHLLAICLTGLSIVGGCSGRGSGLHGPGGTTSTATGGGAGRSTVAASAGTQASGGASGTIMGGGGGETISKTSTSPGGSAGHAGAGSTSATSGATRTGGSGAAVGGGTATGGRSVAGSSSPTAGSSASAGSGSAGTASVGGRGGTASSSGSTSSRNPDAGVGDGGIVASGYCEGNSPKLTYQGQTVSPGVTDFEANIAMDCCNGYGVNLHSTASLGFDVAITLILSVDVLRPGEYEVGGPASIGARALVFKNSDPPPSLGGVNSQGRLRIFGADGSAGFTEFGLCLEVTDTTSTLLGTKIYVPRVIIGSYRSNQRFQIFLLKDSTLRSTAVSTQALDSFVLADYPVLDLSRIAYVEKATSKMGFNPGQKYGNSLRTTLGTPLDLPFVAVADGARIYLGTFTSLISSFMPTGPFVNHQDITADGLTVQAPIRGTDPRNDARIIKALSERGKLVP